VSGPPASDVNAAGVLCEAHGQDHTRRPALGLLVKGARSSVVW
jgi:hypothetical protein